MLVQYTVGDGTVAVYRAHGVLSHQMGAVGQEKG